jgi:O-antigen/teichoic acid export membrane protein
MKVYSREIAWVGAAQAAAFLGGLATVKAAAVNLGPSEYGKLSVALALSVLLKFASTGRFRRLPRDLLSLGGG